MKRLFLLVTVFLMVCVFSAFAADMQKLKQTTDTNGRSTFGLPLAGYHDPVVLVANTAQSYTIPTGATSILFSATCDFYVATSGTAAVPSASGTGGTGVMLNPGLREVGSVASISMISSSACIVTITSFK